MTIHADDGSCRVIMDSGKDVGYGATMLEAAIYAMTEKPGTAGTEHE